MKPACTGLLAGTLVTTSCSEAIWSAMGCLQKGLASVHDGAHDALLRRLAAAEFGDEAAFVHHVDAVAHAEQLRHLRRDHQDAFALARELVDDGVDLVL